MIRTVVFLAGLLAAVVSALELPPYLKPCSRNDPNLDECALKNGIAAIPSILKGDPIYKIPVVNPLKITEVRIEDGNKGTTPTGLDIVMRDLNVYGLDKVELNKAHFDLQNKKIEIAVHIPELRLLSKYEIDGRILVVNIRGKGNGTINMKNVDITYGLDYDLVTKKDGLEYMKAGKSNLVHKAMHMQIYLDNLFNGDKTLGADTNRFLNDNWQVVNEEIGPYFAQAIGEAITQIIKSCMELFDYKHLFPEKV